jgi:hypothetical protein
VEEDPDGNMVVGRGAKAIANCSRFARKLWAGTRISLACEPSSPTTGSPENDALGLYLSPFNASRPLLRRGEQFVPRSY